MATTPQLPNRRRRPSGRNFRAPNRIEVQWQEKLEGKLSPESNSANSSSTTPADDTPNQTSTASGDRVSTGPQPRQPFRTGNSVNSSSTDTDLSPAISSQTNADTGTNIPASETGADIPNQPEGADTTRPPEENPGDNDNNFLFDPQSETYDQPGNKPESPTTQDEGPKKSWRDRFRRKPKDTPDRDELANKEESGGDEPTKDQASKREKSRIKSDAGKGDNDSGSRNRFRALKALLATRRRKVIFGTAVGGGIASLIVGFSFISGPLEFLHIAQLLQKSHFSHQQNAGDDRMGRLYRFARSGGDVGETRLSYLGSTLHSNMMDDLKKIGIKPNYAGAKVYQGFEIDRSNPESPYKDMSNSELKATLEEKGVKISDLKINGAKATITVKGYVNQRRSLKFLADETNIKIIPSVVRVRVMARYGLVTWHPLKILDRKTNERLADFYKRWQDGRKKYLSGKEGNNSVKTSGGQDSEDPNHSTAIPDTATELEPTKVQSTLKAIGASKSLKVTGGVAAVAGIVCAAKAVNDSFADIKFVQIIAPLMRMAFDVVTTAAQIMSGQQVDLTQLNFLSKSFDGKDSTNPSGPSTDWNSARTFQAQMGNPNGGIDIDPGTKSTITQGSPDWLAWTDSTPINGLCSTAGSIATGVFSTALGIFSGAVVSTIVGAAAGALAGPTIIDKLSHLLAGDAVDVLAAGAQWGNYINYGARLAGNSMAALFGGVALTAGQVAELNAQENAIDQADFNSHGLAYRLFNPDDQRSAVAKLIDNGSPSINQNLAKMGGYLFNFGNMFNPAAKLATAHVSAASTATYDYGFSEYGFSAEDLNNPAVEDPYANAEDVAKLLDGGAVAQNNQTSVKLATKVLYADSVTAAGKTYIQKAKDCFGVDITKSDQGWDVVPGDKPVNTFANDYPSDCASSDPNWLKVRFFILDTGVMEGYACYQGDDTSCQNDGFDGTTSTAASGTVTTTPQTINGDAKDLAQQILANKNIDKSGRDVSIDLQDAASGKPSSSGAPLSAAILRYILTIAQNHTISISALESGGTGHSHNSQHYSGDAVDINIIDGTHTNGRDANALDVIKIGTQVLPRGSRFGQSGCPGEDPNLSDGYIEISDSCDHLHTDVPDGTP